MPSCKDCSYIDQILDFLEKKIDACGNLYNSPDRAALLSVYSYILQIQRMMQNDQRRTRI